MQKAHIFPVWGMIFAVLTAVQVYGAPYTPNYSTGFRPAGDRSEPQLSADDAADSISASLDDIVQKSIEQENSYYTSVSAPAGTTFGATRPSGASASSITAGLAEPSNTPTTYTPTTTLTPIQASQNNLNPQNQNTQNTQSQSQSGSTSQQAPKPSLGEFSYNEEDLSQVDKDLIFEGLKQLYYKKVLPLELASKYAHFASPPMGPSDFDAKPMVLILGQYSVGKTSFIRSLLQQDFPGQRIGPEPTTDRFTAIMHTDTTNTPPSTTTSSTTNTNTNTNTYTNTHTNTNNNTPNRLLPGHALVMQHTKPFRGLASFGNNFLSKFEGAEVNAQILRNITIVDTPGVLAGEKQRLGRDYDFSEVIKWFAERADMIIIMFDAHKLDISDELRSVLDALKPQQEKIRVLLNKADTIDTQSLLRVYGALMWSLGKVVQTPEVCRVYLGSFWEAPLKLEDNRALLEREKRDLLNEMMALPQGAVVRRINELVKRARSVKVHAYILHYLKKQMPYVIGRSDKQRRLLERLDREFVACARRYNLPLGDFPNVDVYRKILREIKDISGFKRLDKNLVYEMDRVLTHDIPLLLQKATTRSSSGSGGGSNSGSGGGGKIGVQYSIYNPLKGVFGTTSTVGNSNSDGTNSNNGGNGGNGGGNNADAIATSGVTTDTTLPTPLTTPVSKTTTPDQQQYQQHQLQYQQYQQQYHPNTQPYIPPSYPGSNRGQ